jgi:hypothetical protein
LMLAMIAWAKAGRGAVATQEKIAAITTQKPRRKQATRAPRFPRASFFVFIV